MRKITAKFPSKCAETGKLIRKGEPCYYDPARKLVFHPDSGTAAQEESHREAESYHLSDPAVLFFDDWVSRNL